MDIHYHTNLGEILLNLIVGIDQLQYLNTSAYLHNKHIPQVFDLTQSNKNSHKINGLLKLIGLAKNDKF